MDPTESESTILVLGELAEICWRNIYIRTNYLDYLLDVQIYLVCQFHLKSFFLEPFLKKLVLNLALNCYITLFSLFNCLLSYFLIPDFLTLFFTSKQCVKLN